MRSLLVFAALLGTAAVAHADPVYRAELVFPLHPKHNHAPGIVECPNGDLLVSWYRGSGERSADDVAVYGARRRKGAAAWSDPFPMADHPGFPDCNTALFIDRHQKLWLFWPIILDNTWSSCLTCYRTARVYDRDGRVAYKGGRGPFGFKGLELEQSLIMLLLDQGADAKSPRKASAAASRSAQSK